MNIVKEKLRVILSNFKENKGSEVELAKNSATHLLNYETEARGVRSKLRKQSEIIEEKSSELRELQSHLQILQSLNSEYSKLLNKATENTKIKDFILRLVKDNPQKFSHIPISSITGT
eukprot:TRINITY_DN10961_c0_g1_i2.p1 TRINITY_DN10961_c0_g1~~TRINITY_DN10961_c0_g1_i2.p1  ORF type:complete len:118 (+),score=21.18 TRINITY_DN10961_c0_g1_i2:68-421(+)